MFISVTEMWWAIKWKIMDFQEHFFFYLLVSQLKPHNLQINNKNEFNTHNLKVISIHIYTSVQGFRFTRQGFSLTWMVILLNE